MTIVVGHDGSDSGDDAAALGARLALATSEPLLVVTVYPEENPIGVGRVDAEWVAAMRDHAKEVSAVRAALPRVARGRGRVPRRGLRLGGARPRRRRRGRAGLDDRRRLRAPRRPPADLTRLDRRAAPARRDLPRGDRAARLPRARLGHAGQAHRRVVRGHAGGARGAALRGRAGQGHRRVADALHGDRAAAPRCSRRSSAATPRRRSWPRSARTSRAALEARATSLPEGVEATEELLEGDTVDALAALDEREIDLLVCGSRGYGPVRRVLLGGVLRKLIRRAACPVVVVPRGAAASWAADASEP